MGKSKAVIFTAILFLILSFRFQPGSSRKSKIISFNHLGWGDTIYAFIDGAVSSEEKGGQTSLINVKVKLISSALLVTDSTVTDSNGHYDLQGFKGIYRINFAKPNFQALTIENYESWPDMSSIMNVQLEKGDEGQVYFLPDSLQFNGKFNE